MENFFSGDQIIEILKLGLIGLVFVFVFFTYLLLRAEQSRDGEPSEKMLKSVRNFSIISLVCAIVVGFFSVLELTLKSGQQDCSVCKESLEKAVMLSSSPQQTVISLRQLIKNNIEPCIQRMESEEELNLTK